MSEIISVNETNNQAHFDYDRSNIFIYNNRYEVANFINLTGGILTYKAGTVLGRISATGKVTELKSGATDGSQLPIGILATDINSLAGSGTIDINMCIEGDVAEEKVIFNGADVLTTAKSGRIYRDWLTLVGVILKLGRDLTNYDNQ
jgi:hypothetical protein